MIETQCAHYSKGNADSDRRIHLYIRCLVDAETYNETVARAERSTHTHIIKDTNRMMDVEGMSLTGEHTSQVQLQHRDIHTDTRTLGHKNSNLNSSMRVISGCNRITKQSGLLLLLLQPEMSCTFCISSSIFSLNSFLNVA